MKNKQSTECSDKAPNDGAANPPDMSDKIAAPSLSIVGEDAIREAFAGDLRDLENLLMGALREELDIAADKGWWIHVHGLFDDAIVVETKKGRLQKYSYAIDGTKVTLGEPVEVIKSFVPVGKNSEMSEAFFESKAGKASYRIRVIKSGLSRNNNYYPDSVLRESVGMFEGVRVFVKSDEEHLRSGGKDIRNLIGALKNPAFIEGNGKDSGEIQADLVLIETEGDIAVKLREAWNQQLTDLFGFSISATGKVDARNIGIKHVREAKKFTTIKSVDLIVEPGAGGGIVNLIECKQGEKLMNRNEIINLLEAKNILKPSDVENMTDEELKAHLAEALDNAADDKDESDEKPLSEASDYNYQAEDVIALVEAKMAARDAIDSSALPDLAKERLRDRFAGDARFTEREVKEAVREEAEYLSNFTESGHVRDAGLRIEAGETREEKTEAMLEAFFDPGHKDHRHANSIKECYIAITGDRLVTGRISECDQSLMTEALGTADLANVLGNSMHRRLLADYNTERPYDIWKYLADIVPVQDFRTQERTRIGGYGDMPLVGEGDDYEDLTSPGDDKASYAAQKYGGIETITLEMIKNDDVKAVRQIPVKMSRAAKRTLSKFVLNMVADNPVIYDGKNLFHADHNNLGTDPLDKTSLAAARLRMLKQREPGSNEPLGIAPSYLFVAPDREEEASDLFRRNLENDKSFIQSQMINVMSVWYWEDPDNWFLSADKHEVPSIEVGFLDGREEPELFIQDNPNQGSLFASDKISYKLRHIYGGNIVDYRGLDGNIVA